MTGTHYNQHTTPAPEVRFWEYVDKTGECWLWTGGKHDKGYGAMFFEGRTIGAHRFAYQLLVGPVPEDCHLHHECHVPACVNPSHLRIVTKEEHPTLHGRSVTHCKHGHEFTPENTRFNQLKNGHVMRACRICDRHRKRAMKAAS